MSALLLAAVLCSSATAFVPPSSLPGAGLPEEVAARVAAAELAAAEAEAAAEEASASWSPLALGVALGFMVAVVGGRAQSAMAADIENGASVFGGNCAACHAGGNNSVQAEKKLKKEALTQYGMYDIEKIKTQVTNGKNAMPAFGEKLAPDDIEDVATYVLSQADKGWA